MGNGPEVRCGGDRRSRCPIVDRDSMSTSGRTPALVTPAEAAEPAANVDGTRVFSSMSSQPPAKRLKSHHWSEDEKIDLVHIISEKTTALFSKFNVYGVIKVAVDVGFSMLSGSLYPHMRAVNCTHDARKASDSVEAALDSPHPSRRRPTGKKTRVVTFRFTPMSCAVLHTMTHAHIQGSTRI